MIFTLFHNHSGNVNLETGVFMYVAHSLMYSYNNTNLLIFHYHFKISNLEFSILIGKRCSSINILTFFISYFEVSNLISNNCLWSYTVQGTFRKDKVPWHEDI